MPKGWHTDPRYLAGGYWECTVKLHARMRKQYENMSMFDYNRRLLYQRRYKALRRRREKVS